jgi:IPT/TIG domain/Kelch motif
MRNTLLKLVTVFVAAALPIQFAGCGSDPVTSTYADAGGENDNCPNGQALCGAVCLALTSTAHCGSCTNVCETGEQCCEGSCIGANDCSARIGKLEPNRSPLNGAVWTTINGAGFAKDAKVFIGEARAPALVISPTQIRVEVPPGPNGPATIRIEQGGKKITNRSAFQYITGDLAPPWRVIPLKKLRGENPGISLLQSGKVVIAGGTSVPDSNKDSSATLEIFERSDESVAEQPTPMGTPRMQNASVTLLDGNVLLFGGGCEVSTAVAATCTTNAKLGEIYDPKTGTVRATTGPMQRARVYPRSVLLPDGRVFISSAAEASVEIYDPSTDVFTLVPHSQLHNYGFAVRMRDGRVLFGGGDALVAGGGGTREVEVFDPETNSIKPAGMLKTGRSMLTAHTLPDGRVAVFGGSNGNAGGIIDPLTSIELYDPKSDSWSESPLKLSLGRTWHAGALVRDGSVLVMGGYTQSGQCNSSVGNVDQVDFLKGTVTSFDPLPEGKKAVEWNAITLLDGSIVAVGGGACGTESALPEIYFLPGAPLTK